METKKDVKFLITGGHITPAISVIGELQRRGYTKFLWVGRKKTMKGDTRTGAEYRVVHDQMNIPFIHSITGKIIRFNSVSTFMQFCMNIVLVFVGMIQALFILSKHRPSCIISFGGYVPIPFVIVGKILGIPSVTHEQTTVSGLANKIISKFTRKIFISWKQSEKYFDKEKTVLVGNPYRKEILYSTTNEFSLNSALPTLYITGGNQGAHVINTSVKPILKPILDRMNIIHQTGATTVTKDYDSHKKIEQELRGKTKGIYIVRDFIFGKEIGEVFSKADLMVSRSGANISTEILALGKLSILIPIPWSLGNEQLENAKMLEEVGIGYILQEKDLQPEQLKNVLFDTIVRIQTNVDYKNKPLKQTIQRAKSLVRDNAQELIAVEIEKLLKG